MLPLNGISIFVAYCSLLYALTTNQLKWTGFPCRIAYDPCTWDVARVFGKRIRHKLQASGFLCLLKVEQHPASMDHAILHRKPFGTCFIK